MAIHLSNAIHLLVKPKSENILSLKLYSYSWKYSYLYFFFAFFFANLQLLDIL